MSPPTQKRRERVERERSAYEEARVWHVSNRWHRRACHVFECPNTLRHERLVEDLTAAHVRGGRVLELGCGNGRHALEFLDQGAAYVLGLDVAETPMEEALRRENQGRLEFRIADAHEPVEGTFDLVFGRAILHHLEYRPVVERLYRDNLAPGGAMVFMEPLGANLISLLYRTLVPDAHTPDERPFDRRDLRWFRKRFPEVEIHPYNYLSYGLGVVSSFVARDPDNALLRAADRVDSWLAASFPALAHRFRQSVIVVRKPDVPRSPGVDR